MAKSLCHTPMRKVENPHVSSVKGEEEKKTTDMQSRDTLVRPDGFALMVHVHEAEWCHSQAAAAGIDAEFSFTYSLQMESCADTTT